MSERCSPCNDKNGAFIESKERAFPAQAPVSEKRTFTSQKVKSAKTITDEVCVDCTDSEQTIVNCPQGTTQKLVPNGESYCEEVNGVRTGYSISVYIDSNPCSSTFNQAFPIKLSSVNCNPNPLIGVSVSGVSCDGNYVNV